MSAFLHAKRSATSNLQRACWFLLFVSVNHVFKVVGKRLGLAVDRGKTGTFSMYFTMEFVCSLFYYMF